MSESSGFSSARPLLMYLHGFLSSPQSYKCQLLQGWLRQHHPEIVFYAPLVSPYPGDAAAALSAAVEDLCRTHRGPLGLVGSSMGGFWCTWLAERYQLPAVLVNPAVKPSRFMPKYIGEELRPYSGEPQIYRLGQADVATMSQLEQQLPQPLGGRYWLLAQRGDETLDCGEAEAFYAGQRQTVEDGGDHSFQGFARYTAALVDFLFRNNNT